MMGMSLLATKSPGTEVHAVLRRLVANVAVALDALPERAEDRVHDIRVGMKKFRAVLRLVEPALPDAAFTALDDLARRLKDHFGSTRDNNVQRELLLDLFEKDRALSLASELGFREEPGVPQVELPDGSIRSTCEALAALVNEIHPVKLTDRDVAMAWIACYRGSRRAMSACVAATGDDHLFHEWRKRVKMLLYQSATIGPPVNAVVPKADRLATELGSHHDLAILTQRLSERLAGSTAERAALSRKKFLARRALVRGRPIFSEKPSAISRRMKLP